MGRKFMEGDRVRLLGDALQYWGETRPGDTGVVCTVTGYNVGVRFDRYVAGHDCDGFCEVGHGFWIMGKDLELIEQDDPEPLELPDVELMFNL